MTDGVARELEQAGARLAELQGWLESKIATRHSVALRDVLTTAEEVGRLRALAGVGGEQQAYDAAWEARRAEGHPIDRETHKAFASGWLAASRHWHTALAAREEVK